MAAAAAAFEVTPALLTWGLRVLRGADANVPDGQDRSQGRIPAGNPYGFRRPGPCYLLMADASWKRERMPSFWEALLR